MSRLRPLALALVAVLTLCVFTGSAAAKTAKLSPAADCAANDGRLTQQYTVAQLKQALTSISSSDKEYTTCSSVIQNQLELQLGAKNINGGGGSGSGGGSGTLILVIVVVVVILVGGGGALWAYRRNQRGDGDQT